MNTEKRLTHILYSVYGTYKGTVVYSGSDMTWDEVTSKVKELSPGGVTFFVMRQSIIINSSEWEIYKGSPPSASFFGQ